MNQGEFEDLLKGGQNIPAVYVAGRSLKQGICMGAMVSFKQSVHS